jgi:transposase InsO family protein
MVRDVSSQRLGIVCIIPRRGQQEARPIAFRSPWQNAYVERLIGSIRRECLDHMIVFGQAHLRRILGAYAAYYNESRTHRSLNKDAPFHRAIERLGAITSYPVLGGLHHQYCRI